MEAAGPAANFNARKIEKNLEILVFYPIVIEKILIYIERVG